MAGEANSDELGITTIAPIGVVIIEPGVGSQYFKYGNLGRTESLNVNTHSESYLTQIYPEYSFAVNETQTLSINIVIPYGPSHSNEVRTIRRMVRSRKVLVYRDNRSRIVSGVLLSVTINDVPEGTRISGTFRASEFKGLPI